MKTDIVLSIIIVSYNTAKLTCDAVQSVIDDIAESQILRDSSEIIVVDNGSKDSTLHQLKSITVPPTIKFSIIKNTENIGFARANNQGIKKSIGEFILLLNSDTIVHSGTLSKLVTGFSQSSDDRLGIIGARLEFPGGQYQPQGGWLPTLPRLIAHMFFLDDIPYLGSLFPTLQQTGVYHSQPSRTDDTINVLHAMQWISGTAMCIRRSVVTEIGYLDENLFMYAEDLEFCYRAHHKHWSCALHTGATVTHIQSASSSPRNAIIGEFKGLLYIWAKHRPIWELRFARTILKLGAYLRIIAYGVLRQTENRKTYQLALQSLHSV